MNIYYLNNSGSRWVVMDRRTEEKQKVSINHKNPDGTRERITRTAIEFRAFGNFASVLYSYKGKKETTLDYELLTSKKIPNQQVC
jgi:hypothetical protein